MLKKIIFFVGCLAFMLSACKEEDSPLTSVDSQDRMELVTSIASLADLPSRVVTSVDGKGNFTEGDKINFFVFSHEGESPSFLMPQLTDGHWSPDMNWSDFDTNRASFKAYYPAFRYYGGPTELTVPLDQRNRTNYEQADLLYAETTASKGEPVELNFTHRMSRLTVKLHSNSLTKEQLGKATIQVYAYNRIMLDPHTGEFGKIQGKYPEYMHMRHVGDGTYQLILPPQPVLEEWHDYTWMSIGINGGGYSYLAPIQLDNGQLFNEFQAGKEVVLHINMTSLPSMAGQTVWVEGLNVPPVESWGWAFIKPYTPGLTWKPEYGWYDCNKIEPETGHQNDDTSDSNLCWAASASNLIYWWLDRNQESIRRYGKFNPDEWTYVDALNCPIFHYYNDHFPNVGNNVAAGINWFFTGKPAGETLPGGGFFKEVIGNRQIVRVGGSTEYAFSRDLKFAFINKEAVELTHKMMANTHAITLWGAEFDANDKVSAIYVCDNNDRTNDSETQESIDKATGKPIVKIGLYRRKIAYRNGLVYMENSVGNCTIQIQELNFLSSCEDLWEEYFQKHS